MAKSPASLTDSAVWKPAAWKKADAAAIQALIRGEATASQQQRALRWIVDTCARTYDMSFRPEGDRDTVFAEGRRFVGLQIVKLTRLDLNKFKED